MSTFRAQIDDFFFEIKSDGINDTWQKNVPEYDIPFSRGASLDSLGVKSRPIRFTAIFRNENYASHQAFIAHALKDQYNTLIHPKYGPVKGMVKTLSVNHGDRINYSEINIDFVEEADSQAAPVYAPSVTQITEDVLVAGQMQSMASLKAELSAGLGTGASDALSQDLDPESETG
ncbi:MAG TPA: DNA circularization N-terminal domain-containing protein, partial [Chitinispirillaceae bacterium]|nr:DNA circularization N-terminal domain-containing protein [Chitinispirillaceae bacterium]